MSYVGKARQNLLRLCLVQGDVRSKINCLGNIVDNALTDMPKVCAQTPTVLCLATGTF